MMEILLHTVEISLLVGILLRLILVKPPIRVDATMATPVLPEAPSPPPPPLPSYDTIRLLLCDQYHQLKHEISVHQAEPPAIYDYGGAHYVLNHVQDDMVVYTVTT